jgi:hypothetical protein
MDREEPTLSAPVRGFRNIKRTISVPNHGSPSTALNPAEYASLRRVAKGLGHTISNENKIALLAMGLAGALASYVVSPRGCTRSSG